MSHLERGSALRVISRPARRSLARPAALAVLAASVGLLTACGSSGSNDPAASSTPAASASATTPAATPAATQVATPAATSAAGGSAAPACTAADVNLVGAKTASPASAATGTSYYRLVFQNTGSSSCSMTGYLNDVTFLTNANTGPQIGPRATDQAVSSPAAVTLAPGGTAYATLSVKSGSDYSASVCKPVSTQTLDLGLPGQEADLGTPLPGLVQICSSRRPAVAGQVGIATLQPGDGASNPEL